MDVLTIYFEDRSQRDVINAALRAQPWTLLIIRALAFQRGHYATPSIVYYDVERMRRDAGIPLPNQFKATVRCALQRHDADSTQFGHAVTPENNLFRSTYPIKPVRWCLRDPMRARQWIENHKHITDDL